MDISKSSSAQYKVDEKKYRENYERLFGKKDYASTKETKTRDVLSEVDRLHGKQD